MSFTNFCSRSGGSALNAGTRTGDTTVPGTGAAFTYASGNYTAATNTFTVASGNPSTDGVAAGDWVSIYADGSSATGFVARVTSVTSTTIVTSASAIHGAKPSDGTGNRTCKVGGAWSHPNGTTQFPFSFVRATAVNTSSNPMRLNVMNDATISMTAAIANNTDGITIHGFTSAYGDGGRFTLSGATSGSSYAPLTMNGSSPNLANAVILNNGNSGTSAGLTMAGGGANAIMCRNVVVHDVRGHGFNLGGSNGTLIDCEAYLCNQSNTANLGGISFIGSWCAFRCISHDNAGSNASGFVFNSGGALVSLINCIADTNGKSGLIVPNQSTPHTIILNGCELYANVSDGITVANNGDDVLLIENCNFIKNGTGGTGYGINFSGTGKYVGMIRNCGFGAGTQANATGTVNGTQGCEESGSVTYASDATPWTDPANGDFRIALSAAKGTGYGAFTQTAASYSGTVSYPDVGAAQHLEAAAGGGLLLNSGMTGGLRG